MRLIDADALINDILTDYGCDPKYIADETIDGLKPYTDQLILERIGLQPTIPASQWHSVEEELPRGQELVIVAVKDAAGDTPFWYTQCGWITRDGEYWIIDNEICDYVVAWMPLPEPPKEDA